MLSLRLACAFGVRPVRSAFVTKAARRSTTDRASLEKS